MSRLFNQKMDVGFAPSRVGRPLVVTALLAAVACGSGGCLFGAHTDVTQNGNYVQTSTWDQIKPGVTAGFVEATLGKPDTITPVKDDGSEIWKWAYSEDVTKTGFVIFIFAGSDKQSSKHAAYVQVKDGVVVKAWRG